jgi:hypothetical protein
MQNIFTALNSATRFQEACLHKEGWRAHALISYQTAPPAFSILEFVALYCQRQGAFDNGLSTVFTTVQALFACE